MKPRYLRIIAMLLVISSLVSFAACNGNGDETTTDETTLAPTTGGDVTDEPTEDVLAASTDSNATTAITTTTATGTTDSTAGTTVSEQTTASPQSSALSSKEDIVKYYADAVNKVKSSAKSVAKIYENNHQYNNILELGNSMLNSVASSIMGMFLKENNDRTDYSGTADIVANFPPARSQCNATAAVIDTATCKDMGTYYEVTLTTASSEQNPDVNPPAGGGKVGTILTVVESNSITDAIESFPITISGIKNSYYTAKVIAHIEKDTGNMTYLETYLPSVMSFDEVKMLISITGVRIGLQYDTKWEVTW